MEHEGSSLSVDHRMDGGSLGLHFDQILTPASLLFVSNPGNQKCNLLGLRGKRGGWLRIIELSIFLIK